MPVVGADHDIVFAGVFKNVRQVVIGLTGDVDVIIANNIFRAWPLAALKPPGDLNAQVGNPLGAHLDETEA